MEVAASRVVAAAPDRVMRALTDPRDLGRWCGERLTVTDEVYQLRGSGLPNGAMGGRLLERGSRLLRFEWPLGEGTSTVTISLEAVPQSGNPPADFTRVSVRHQGVPDGVLKARWPKETWGCVWSLWLRQLQGWVERAEVPAPFTYPTTFGRVIEQSLELDAPPSRVWRALTDPEVRQRWLTVPLGEELRREEGRLLVCTFELDPPATTLTWLLEPLPGERTRLTLREEGLTWEGIDNDLGWFDYLVALRHETARPMIRQTVLIQAPSFQVWPYIASQEGLRRWFSGNILFEARVGTPIVFEEHGGRLWGRVTAVEPERRLSFTWTEEGASWPEPEPLLITLELAAEEGGTRVTLTHDGFENLPEAILAKEFASYQRGWSEGESLVELRRIVESGESLPTRQAGGEQTGGKKR